MAEAAPTGTALELVEAPLSAQPLLDQENHPQDSVLLKPLGHGDDGAELDAPIFIYI